MATIKPNRIYSDIDLDFSRHPVTGDIPVRADINAVKQSLKNLIQTSFYERLFHPEIGSQIRRLLFEPVDPVTTSTLKASLERLILNFEPRVQLIAIDVIPNYNEDAYAISIAFTIVGIGSPVTYSTLLRRVR